MDHQLYIVMIRPAQGGFISPTSMVMATMTGFTKHRETIAAYVPAYGINRGLAPSILIRFHLDQV
jgi:hypothetical protein